MQSQVRVVRYVARDAWERLQLAWWFGLHIVGALICMAAPIYGVWSAVFWLKHGVFPGYSLCDVLLRFDVLGECATVYTPYVGWGRILNWLWLDVSFVVWPIAAVVVCGWIAWSNIARIEDRRTARRLAQSREGV